MSRPLPSAQLRRLTVCNRRFPRAQGTERATFPELRLSGKWLADQGFRSGHTVDIACSAGRLVITLAEKQRFDL